MPDDRPCACGCANTFGTKDAKADLQRYRERGPDPTTGALIAALVAEGVDGATLLDVGAGIGAIQLGLLPAGLGHAESVDASAAYVRLARGEANRRGFGDRTTGRVGNFIQLADDVHPADIVTLDRVVCCDPNMPELLRVVASHARRVIGMVYPRETWWNRIGARLMDIFGRFRRDSTRWHLHRHADIDSILTRAGFVRRDVSRSFIWQVVLYVRDPAGTVPASSRSSSPISSGATAEMSGSSAVAVRPGA